MLGQQGGFNAISAVRARLDDDKDQGLPIPSVKYNIVPVGPDPTVMLVTKRERRVFRQPSR